MAVLGVVESLTRLTYRLEPTVRVTQRRAESDEIGLFHSMPGNSETE